MATLQPSASADPAVAARQRAIVKALRAGASLSVVDKEGGWRLSVEGESFVQSGYGADAGRRVWASEAEMLVALLRSLRHEVARGGDAAKLSDAEVWRRIEQRLEWAGAHRPGDVSLGRFGRIGRGAVAAAVAVVVAGPVAYLKFHQRPAPAPQRPLAVVAAPPQVTATDTRRPAAEAAAAQR